MNLDRVIKILLLLLAIFPLWLTIAAFGETTDPIREVLNEKFQEANGRRVQISELIQGGDTLRLEDLSTGFEIDGNNLRPSGISWLSIRLTDEKGLLKRAVKIPAKLSIQDKVLIAQRNLNTHSTFTREDFKEEWRDASTLRGERATEKSLDGKEIKVSLREGDVLYESALKAEQLVTKGDRVKINVLSSGLAITTAGIAQEAGVRGQTIRVVNPESKKEMFAVVADDKVVELRL